MKESDKIMENKTINLNDIAVGIEEWRLWIRRDLAEKENNKKESDDNER